MKGPFGHLDQKEKSPNWNINGQAKVITDKYYQQSLFKNNCRDLLLIQWV
ncbi:hypothetical protein Echvi_0869 [Echinicola vietnamensis DSM 17526]|uniref:Uncharacterized protein n=1 Tax=Echinicola vietnamensis (strain DSM 17526 / LMG 23754 / KMM 6221) TaxID=926556 RepID=L0FV14_ECHVK|nr:hypothetical protein Echvi_0869 [Echinicola vietnamensis DSM 17526]